MARHVLSWRSTKKRSLYFVEAENGLIKIGITDDLEKRLRVLQDGSPVALTLLLAVPGTARQEGTLHGRFIDERSHGEWFRGSARLRVFIEELRSLDSVALSRRLRNLKTIKRESPRLMARRLPKVA